MNYLEIGGKQHPLKFTFSKILELSAMHDAEYISEADKIVTNMKMAELPKIVFLGLQGGAESMNKECAFKSTEEVTAEFEKDQQLIGRAMAIITKDLTDAFTMPEENNEEEALSEGAGKSDGVKYKK